MCLFNCLFLKVKRYGMSEKLGYLVFEPHDFGYSSEQTAQLIESEVQRIIAEVSNKTKKLLNDHREHVENVALHLIQKEVLTKDELSNLLGPRPFKENKIYDERDGNVTSAKEDDKLLGDSIC